MSSPDEVTYGRGARLRVAMAALAAEISGTAREMVATYRDGGTRPGERAGEAASLVADARQLLSFAIAYERHRGTSWEEVAGWLSPIGLNSPPAALAEYGDTVKRLDDMLTECWLLGDDPKFPGAPEGTADTARAAGRLDGWVAGRLTDHEQLAHKAPDDPDRLFPVSGRLEPLDTAEHSSSLTAAAGLIAERRRQYGPDDPSARYLELGLARRGVELYEHMLADELAGKGTGTPADQLRALLVGAQARLAELEAARRPDERLANPRGARCYCPR